MRTSHDDLFSLDEELYDDPYEVVMYDIDTHDDDLYALIAMLGDDSRSWYAKRRLNALVASGPLSALVADIIIDSLGRRWDPLRHPRDRYGRFINTGGFLRWLAGAGGEWLRGQVSRIDSDGNIHVRAVGNDRVPDGTVYRFKPEMASKLVSTESPVATLEDIDLDADIPDFPEASDVQKRIWNNLANGDIPAEDLDRSLADLDLSVEDFAGEVKGLEDRGLIEVDRSGDKPRVRRNDADVKAVVDVGDDEIADVPEDDTPDLTDGPTLSREQRDLLDRIVELDNGEGDGVGRDELADVDGNDIQELMLAGALKEDPDSGRLFLENPESDEAPEPAAEEPDIGQEIFDQAAAVSDDPDVQEAFQHYAEELARPGDENNIPLPEELAPAKRRNAEAAANAWWSERNAGTDERPDEAVLDQREADKFADEGPDPKDVLNERNQAMADQLVAEYFDDEEWLDSNEGVEYRGAIKRLFDAEDLDENGFSAQADAERDKADRALRRIGAPDEDIDGWPIEVQNMRNADQEGAAPEDVVPGEDVPEADLPEADVPEADVPDGPAEERQAPVDLNDRPSAALYLRDDPDAQRLVDEGAEEYEWGSEAAMKDIAAGFPALTDEEHDSLWGKSSGYAEGYRDAYADEAPDVPKEVDVPPAADAPALTGRDAWEEFGNRLRNEGEADNFFDRLNQEAELADEMGLDLRDEDAFGSWNSLADEYGHDLGEILFESSDGSLGKALALYVNSPEYYDGLLEDKLLQRFMQEGRDPGPEVMRLHKAGLIEDNGMGDWRLTQAGRDRLGIVDELPDAEGVVSEGNDSVDVSPDAPEDLEPVDAVDLGVPAVSVPEAALVPSADVPEHAKAIEQPDPADLPNLTVNAAEARDRNGQIARVGQWYRAGAGGEGDPGELVAFYDQEKYPNWVVLKMPDGKMKGANLQGKGRDAGLNRIDKPSDNELQARRVQRAVKDVGFGDVELDQFNAMNVLRDGVPAEVGMRVVSDSGGQKFPRGEEGVIVRFGWSDKWNRPIVYVIRPGAGGQRDEIQMAPKSLKRKEETPLPPTPSTPSPDVPNLPDLPDRALGVPSDDELIQFLGERGGEEDYIKFVNAFQNPGVVDDQIRALIQNGRLEFVPEDANHPGAPRLRVVGGNEVAPNVFPDGAENNAEAQILRAIDNDDDGRWMRRSEIIDVDADNIEEQFQAVSALVDRGVLEKSVDPDSGKLVYRRRPVTAEPDFAQGANNEVENDLLDIIDGKGDAGAFGADLVDIDATDAADKMQALRNLVDRRVLSRDTDGEDGRPVYRRREAGGQTVVAMTDDEAADALRGGADPMLIASPNLERALRKAGYRFQANGAKGISENDWAISPQDAEFPINLHPYGQQNGHVYMIKQSADILPNDMMNEVMAGAISEDLRDKAGADAPGLLYHPRVAFAKAPKRVGSGKDGAIIMDHVAYGFGPDHQVLGGKRVDDSELVGDAAKSVIGLALFDYMINNTEDRHRNNQMYVKGPDGSLQAVVIDNGFGFGGGRGGRNYEFSEYAQAWRPLALLQRVEKRSRERAMVEAAVQDFVQTYQQMDTNDVMDRIKALHPTMTPEQEAYVLKWLEIAKERVDSLAVDIDSVVDIIVSA